MFLFGARDVWFVIALPIYLGYGEGELPHSAQPFYNRLEQQAPELLGMSFATFGLGDSFYETFNQGSQDLADKLLALGATELGERGVHDASSGELPGDVAVAWLKELLSHYGDRIMAAGPTFRLVKP